MSNLQLLPGRNPAGGSIRCTQTSKRPNDADVEPTRTDATPHSAEDDSQPVYVNRGYPYTQ